MADNLIKQALEAKMPHRDVVDPLFDGHLERPLLQLTVSERLDWIWAAMQLLRLGNATRLAAGVRPRPPMG